MEKMTFIFTGDYAFGTSNASMSISVSGEDGEFMFIQDIEEALATFLRNAGFTYVDRVKIIKESEVQSKGSALGASAYLDPRTFDLNATSKETYDPYNLYALDERG